MVVEIFLIDTANLTNELKLSGKFISTIYSSAPSQSSAVGSWGFPDALSSGIFLAGPVVCGMSQAANDWCDRHVDAINEPNRPIPSGRMPERWGLGIAIAMSILSLLIGWFLVYLENE